MSADMTVAKGPYFFLLLGYGNASHNVEITLRALAWSSNDKM